MTLPNATLLLTIILFMAYAIYDQLIMPALKGKTGLEVPLQRRNRLDSLIFIALIAILIWKNVQTHGSRLTTTLLMIMAFLSLYLFWIRIPKALFKYEGFFFANFFIRYERIKQMNLSEDGVLVIRLEQRQLLIQVQHLDDLEHIYHFMLDIQSTKRTSP